MQKGLRMAAFPSKISLLNIVPIENIAYLANEKFDGYNILILKRSNQIAILAEGHDCLPKKLMSGEVEV